MKLLYRHINKNNNLLKLSIVISSLLVFPLYPFGPFFPDLFLSLSTLIFFYLMIKKEISFFFKDKLFFFFLSFFIYITLHSFFSINPEISFRSSFFYFRFYIFSIILAYLLIEFDEFKIFLYYIFFYLIFFVVIDTYIQYFFSRDLFGYVDNTHRLSGPFGDELIVGSFISKTLPFLVALHFYIHKKISFNLILLCMLSFFITFLSGERVAFFNLSVFFFIFLYFFNFINKKKILFLLILLSSVLLALFLKFDNSRYDRMVRFPICAMNIDYFKIFDCYEETSGFTNEKLEILATKKKFTFFSDAHEGHFKAGLKMFFDEPIFGKGVKMYRYHCANPKFANQFSCTTHPHNTLIQILAELGIIGLFFLLLAMYFCYKNILILIFSKKLSMPANLKLSFLLSNFSLIQIFFIFLPSGQFFNNYLSILYYLPLGLFLSLYYKFINVK